MTERSPIPTIHRPLRQTPEATPPRLVHEQVSLEDAGFVLSTDIEPIEGPAVSDSHIHPKKIDRSNLENGYAQLDSDVPRSHDAPIAKNPYSDEFAARIQSLPMYPAGDIDRRLDGYDEYADEVDLHPSRAGLQRDPESEA